MILKEIESNIYSIKQLITDNQIDLALEYLDDILKIIIKEQ